MEIKPKEVKVSELFEGYYNNDEEGVVGYDGKLNIRPKYQREFVYKDAQRNEVIRTILKGFPLNVFYWSHNSDDTYEMLDGQQRTISICEYLDGNYSVDGMYFSNYTEDIQDKIKNYKLYVYECEGEESEKLDWFKIINIAGETLTPQELRNAVYCGTWTTDAKRYFSKSNCVASQLGDGYMSGKVNRQEYFQTALKWISDKHDETIEDYMSRHQHDEDAKELWNYFKDVIEWIEAFFPKKDKKLMTGLDWGIWYNKYGEELDKDDEELVKRVSQDFQEKIELLLQDDEISKHEGIYKFLLTGDAKDMQLRQFADNDKRWAFEKQHHKCKLCKQSFDIGQMHGDHIIPWSKGGKTIRTNLQMLCTDCNIQKSAYDSRFKRFDETEYEKFDLKKWNEQ